MKVLEDRAGRTILFEEANHEYHLGRVKLMSVTKFVGSFFQEFDREAIAGKYAMKHNLNVKDVLDTWERDQRAASEKGHNLHAYAYAQAMYKGPLDVASSFDADFEWIDRFAEGYKKINMALRQIKSKFKILGAEVIVASLSLGLAGTIDLLCWDEAVSDVLIFDWKSSKNISMENVWETANPPIEHLDDCNFNHYSLQLNTYERICREENYFPDAKNYRKALIDIESRSTPVFLKVDDLQTEVDHMVRWI